MIGYERWQVKLIIFIEVVNYFHFLPFVDRQNDYEKPAVFIDRRLQTPLCRKHKGDYEGILLYEYLLRSKTG
jgi:hypothetical protein